RKQAAIHPTHGPHARPPRPEEPRQKLDISDFGQSLIPIPQRASDVRGIEIGACRFSKGMRFRPEWRSWSRQRNVVDGDSRTPDSFFRNPARAFPRLRLSANRRRRSRAGAALMHFFALAFPTHCVERTFAIFVRPQMRRSVGLCPGGHARVSSYHQNGGCHEAERKSTLSAHVNPQAPHAAKLLPFTRHGNHSAMYTQIKTERGAPNCRICDESVML